MSNSFNISRPKNNHCKMDYFSPYFHYFIATVNATIKLLNVTYSILFAFRRGSRKFCQGGGGSKIYFFAVVIIFNRGKRELYQYSKPATTGSPAKCH